MNFELVLTLSNQIATFSDVKLEKNTRNDTIEMPIMKWFEVDPTTPVNMNLLAKWIMKVLIFLTDMEGPESKKTKFKIFSKPIKSN